MENPESGKCQLPAFQGIAVGYGEVPPQSLSRRVKLTVRRRLAPRQERRVKRYSNKVMNWFASLLGRRARPAVVPMRTAVAALQPGDRVQVRSREEIEGMLDHWRQLKGCTFMNEMWQYCGTTQRVLKRMERFVDERDLMVKKANGIVLLEGLFCQGTAEFGRCDRSCHYFWREEWLEKVGE